MKRIFSLFLAITMIIAVNVSGISVQADEVLSEKIKDTSDFSLSSIELTEKMLIGYNIGNVFESNELRSNYTRPNFDTVDEFINYKETVTASVPITEEYIKFLKSSGIQAIRLPITWYNVLLDENGEFYPQSTFYASIDKRRDMWFNGKVSPEFLSRIKQVIDWVIENDMYIIINTHHDGACNNANSVNPIKFDYGVQTSTKYAGMTNSEQTIKYLTNIWSQVGTYFKDYGSKLIFEFMNECTDSSGSMTPSNTRNGYVKEVYKNLIPLIREQGSNNAKRFLVLPNYGGVSFFNVSQWKGTITDSSVPEYNASVPSYDSANDKLIVTTHTYPGAKGTAQAARNKMNELGVGAIVDETGSSGNTLSQKAVDLAAALRADSDQYKASLFWWDNGDYDFCITNRMYNEAASPAFSAYVGKSNLAPSKFTKEEIKTLRSNNQYYWAEFFTPDWSGAAGKKYVIVTGEKQITSLKKIGNSNGYYLLNGIEDSVSTFYVSDDGVNYDRYYTFIQTDWTKLAWSTVRLIGSSANTIQSDGNYQVAQIGDGLASYVKTGDDMLGLGGNWIKGQYGLGNGAYEGEGSSYYNSRICLENKIPVLKGGCYYFNLCDSTRYSFIIRSYDSNQKFISNIGTITNGPIKVPDNAAYISIALYDSQNGTNADGLLTYLTDGTFDPSMYSYIFNSKVNRVITFGDSVVRGDGNDGAGAGNRFGDEHFLNILGREYNLKEITKTTDGDENSRWFINLAKNGYTIGDKDYWASTRAPGTYNGTIYEDEVMQCSPTLLKNADTIIMDGGVNDFSRLAGWITAASYINGTDAEGNPATYVGSEKTAAYNIAPGETKAISNMSEDEATAYANKYKALKGADYDSYIEQNKDTLTTAIRSWDAFRNKEAEYLQKIVEYINSTGFSGNIYFMDNPNSFVNKNVGMTAFWDEMLEFCQGEPMQTVADKYDNVQHINIREQVRDAKKYTSSSTDYLHLSYLGNREVYKCISNAIDSEAKQVIFDENYIPETATWQKLFTFESFQIDRTDINNISGGKVVSIDEVASTILGAAENSTKVLYKAATSEIKIDGKALPKNIYGLRIKGLTFGDSILSVTINCGTRNLGKSGRTNINRWGNFNYEIALNASGVATNSITNLGSFINTIDLQTISSITINSSKNSTSKDACYIDDIEVLTDSSVVTDGVCNHVADAQKDKKVEPTCLTDGYTEHTCQYCGIVYRDSITSALGHNFESYVSDNNAACTTDGTETAKCIRCGLTDTKVVENSALGHSFLNYVSDNNATCTTDGTKTAKCDRCDETDTKVIENSALGHSFTNYVSDNNATCTTDGTKTAKCDRCDETDTKVVENSALGHSFTNYVSDNNATCTTDGTMTAKCDRCDKTNTMIAIGSAKGHSIGDWVVTKQPTCTEKGEKVKKCTVCGEVCDTAEIEPLGHNIGDWVITKQPTCTTKGLKIKKCTVCGEVFDTAEIYPLGHSYTSTIVKPTCTRLGYVLHSCSRCGVSYKDNYVDTIAHSYKWVVTKKATYFANGVKSYKCSRCGKASRTISIAKLKLKTPSIKLYGTSRKITVKYTRVSGATGFQVKYVLGKKTYKKTFATTKSATKYITKLKKGKYKVCVCAYVKSGSKYAYSSYTKYKTLTVK